MPEQLAEVKARVAWLMQLVPLSQDELAVIDSASRNGITPADVEARIKRCAQKL